MPVHATRFHPARKTPRACPAGSRASTPFGTKAAIALAAQLDALLERFPSEDLTASASDDSVQPVVDALRTAASDLRHARAALSWVTRPGGASVVDFGTGADRDGHDSSEALVAEAAALGCSVDDLQEELKAPHFGMPLFIP